MFHLDNSKIKKIAVFKALKLGDLLCTVPSFRALRSFFPDALIYLIGLPWAKEFTERYNKYFDGFIEFPGFPGFPEQNIKIQDTDFFLHSIKNKKFDLILQMHGNGSVSNLLIELMNPKLSAGFYSYGHYYPQNGYYMLYPENESEIRRQLKLLEFLGIPSKGENLEFPIMQSDYNDFKKINLFDINKSFKYVCIHPGSISAKPWDTVKFAHVADKLIERGFKVILTGTVKEKQITREVASLMKNKPYDLAGKTTLGSLALLLKNTSLLITNDTGTSHLADALDIPSVVIFTNSKVDIWAPFNDQLHRRVKATSSIDINNVLNQVKKLTNAPLIKNLS